MSFGSIGKPAQVLISVSFLLVVLAPHVMEISGRGGNTASLEKRERAALPSCALLFRSFGEYARRFDAYYGESFGFRDILIRWNSLLSLSAFNDTTGGAKARLGRDGWLFYADERVLEDYENVMPLTHEELVKMAAVLEERRVWLEKRGIKMFIVVPPNKHTIYSEFLPPGIHKIGKESRLDQVKSYLASYPDLEFIDLRDALFRAKPAHRLYYKLDSHWNSYGAFVGYGQLMDRIRLYFPAIKKLSLNDYDLSVQQIDGGDLAGVLSLEGRMTDENVAFVPKFRPRAVDAARPYTDLLYRQGRISIKEIDDPTLPRAVVFHDSFANHLVPFLAESFRSILFAWSHDFLPDLVEREKPDLVIIECVERRIHLLGNENPPEMRAVR